MTVVGMNLLTKEMLRRGFTADNHPGYVRLGQPPQQGQDDPLVNYDGGFVFSREASRVLNWKTGCGLCVKNGMFSEMGYQGVDWRMENGNPVFICPFHNWRCRSRNELLYNNSASQLVFCDAQYAREQYDYENSVEKAESDHDREKKLLLEKYMKAHENRACEQHMTFNEETRAWECRYDHRNCLRACPVGERGGVCGMSGECFPKERGNVFYDLKITSYRKDNSLFNGMSTTVIEKGKRLFDRPMSVGFCRKMERFAKQSAEDYWKWNAYSMDILEGTVEIEVLNVRTEKKEVRDLFADLADIEAGIAVVHESDRVRMAAQEKRERKAAAEQKRRSKVERKIINNGIGGLDWEKEKVEKMLGKERIDELLKQREDMVNKSAGIRQMSLFDLMGAE